MFMYIMTTNSRLCRLSSYYTTPLQQRADEKCFKYTLKHYQTYSLNYDCFSVYSVNLNGKRYLSRVTDDLSTNGPIQIQGHASDAVPSLLLNGTNGNSHTSRAGLVRNGADDVGDFFTDTLLTSPSIEN
jgi:hypothetical protein